MGVSNAELGSYLETESSQAAYKDVLETMWGTNEAWRVPRNFLSINGLGVLEPSRLCSKIALLVLGDVCSSM